MSPRDLTPTAIDFLHGLSWDDLPADVRHRLRGCVLDILGVAAGDHRARLSAIVRDHAAFDMPGPAPMLFGGRTRSHAGAEIVTKFHDLADRVRGKDRADAIEGAVRSSHDTDLAVLERHLVTDPSPWSRSRPTT